MYGLQLVDSGGALRGNNMRIETMCGKTFSNSTSEVMNTFMAVDSPMLDQRMEMFL